MKPSIIAIGIASALAFANVSWAQQPRQSPPPQSQVGETVSVSDADLDTFTTIYVDLLDTVAKFKGEIEAAKSDQESQDVQTRMQAESVAKVAQHGWTPERFNSVTEAINKDPGLADKASRLIEDKS